MIGLIGYRYNIKKQQKTQLHQFKYVVAVLPFTETNVE
jgi:hypothetical protein